MRRRCSQVLHHSTRHHTLLKLKILLDRFGLHAVRAPTPNHRQDGRNWARIEADHHTGALFAVGGEGEADQLCVRSPQVRDSYRSAWIMPARVLCSALPALMS